MPAGKHGTAAVSLVLNSEIDISAHTNIPALCIAAMSSQPEPHTQDFILFLLSGASQRVMPFVACKASQFYKCLDSPSPALLLPKPFLPHREDIQTCICSSCFLCLKVVLQQLLQSR